MKPSTHRALIDALGGNTAVANGIEGCTAVRVGQWKIGNRIPVEYWPDIIRMAHAKDLSSISSDWLMNTVRPRQTA
ncbi:hypothetical protein BES08_10895 [Novosphingobium resinovorum]|uniref:Uncharacterized protein n=1 Tax=Novosphingobium resinovorum TaxID=158500 RepID=A0A1D8A514_9SPHN|nr:hypothetical protein BES08_10895 [Novosphingobium resinovorum]